MVKMASIYLFLTIGIDTVWIYVQGNHSYVIALVRMKTKTSGLMICALNQYVATVSQNSKGERGGGLCRQLGS